MSSRVKINFCLSRPKVQKLPSNPNGNGRPYTPLEGTPEGGLSPGKLNRKARMVNLRSLDTRLMAELGKAKVGTLKIESQALQLACEAREAILKAGASGKSWEKIRKFWNPYKVMDVISLKFKYCKQEEERAFSRKGKP